MAPLSVAGLSLSLGKRLVLDGIDARFRSGEVTAILGPNGAGKSTLLACLAGLRQPHAGQVLLGDVPRTALPARDLARRIGFLPQQADVHWDIDVATLVGLGRYPHRGRWGDSAADRAAVAAAMAATDVARFAGRPVSALSGGERARVLLARVLAGQPEWLLADEPLANLDPLHQHQALACLRRTATAGTGVIVVLHDLNCALQVADAVLLLADGRVVAHGVPSQALTPERIAAIYGVVAHVGTADNGQRFILTSQPSCG